MCTIGDINDVVDMSHDDATVLVKNGYANVVNKVVAEDANNYTDKFYSLSYTNSDSLIKINQMLNIMLKKLKHIIPREIITITQKYAEYAFMQDVLEDQMGSILLQSKGYTNKDWVLLDSQATIDFLYNSLLLPNICEVDGYLNIFYSSGSTRTNMVGDLKGYGTVLFYINDITIILGMHYVAE